LIYKLYVNNERLSSLFRLITNQGQGGISECSLLHDSFPTKKLIVSN